MRYRERETITPVAWLAAALLTLCAAGARAGNDDSILMGNDAALVGGAVVATVNDGSALWYNPAGLARAGQDSVDVAASAFALRRYDMPGLLRADGGSGGDAKFTEFVTVPSALTYTRRRGSSALGLALFASQVADYTLRASLQAPIDPIDGRIRLLLNQETARYHLAGGWARRLPRGFAFGAALVGDYYGSGSFTQGSLDYTFNGDPVAVYAASSYDTSMALGFHARVGATWDVREDLRLGLSVETPGVYFYQNWRSSAVETQTAPGADGALQLATNVVEDEKAKFALGLFSPVRVRFGGSFDAAGASWSLEGDVQSKVKDRDIGVDRTFAWNVRAGARFAVGEALRFGAGFFTDRGADRTDQWGAGSIDFYGATVGGQYQSVRWLATDKADGGKRNRLTFSSTAALRYAVGLGKLQGQYLMAPDYDVVSRAVDITIHELTLHLGSGVYF